jgi:hypothetical protein
MSMGALFLVVTIKRRPDRMKEAVGLEAAAKSVRIFEQQLALARVSQESNTKLVDIARRLTETGELKTAHS